MMRLMYSTDCRWCLESTWGPEYCAKCELLLCDYCSNVYFDLDSEECENCRAGRSLYA